MGQGFYTEAGDKVLNIPAEGMCTGKRTQNFIADCDPKTAPAISPTPRAPVQCDLDARPSGMKSSSPPLEPEPAYGLI